MNTRIHDIFFLLFFFAPQWTTLITCQLITKLRQTISKSINNMDLFVLWHYYDVRFYKNKQVKFTLLRLKDFYQTPLLLPSNSKKKILFFGFHRSPHKIEPGIFPTVRTTQPRQLRCQMLILCTTFISLRSSYSSLFDRMRKSLPTRTVLKI